MMILLLFAMMICGFISSVLFVLGVVELLTWIQKPNKESPLWTGITKLLFCLMFVGFSLVFVLSL